MEASFRKASDAVATLFNRRPGGEETHTLEGPEPPVPRDWPEKLPFRKRPKPYSRAIGWTPGTSGPTHPRDQSFGLFVAQSVLAEVRQHLITATSGEPFGFLIGQVVYCPWAETPYVVIDSVRRETQDLPPANDVDRFRHAWVAANREARRRRGEVLGWYHRHGVLGLRLSEWDLRIQEEFFPDPWHCALVIATSSRGIIGGFIQRSRRAKLFRKGMAPFHEMVDLDAKLVDGLKPSVVDWENYGADEAVSVIRAKWPSPSTRARKWKAKQHGDEVELPTQGDSVAPENRQPRRKGSLGGRTWGTGQKGKKGKTADRPKATPLAEATVEEDDFTSAVGPVGPPVSYVSEEVPEPEVRVPARRKPPPTPATKPSTRMKPAAKKKATSKPTPAETRRAAARKTKPAPEADTEDTAESPDAPEDSATEKQPDGPGGEWLKGDFLDAVWGPPPFEAEEGEPQTGEDKAEVEGAGDEAATGARPAFELVPNFEPEPPEVDRPGSMDWLLGLVGETLAGRKNVADASSTQTTESVAADGATDPPPVSSKRHRAGLAIPESKSRQTYVSSSHNPDVDPEAQIPVLMFAEGAKWRPTRKQKRAATVAAAVVVLAIVVQLFRGWFGSEAPAPIRGTPTLVVSVAPTEEFVELADDFLTGLQGFRERLVEFRLGQVECAQLTTEIVGVAVAHGLLNTYVESNPDLADRFVTMDTEFAATRDRFAATDCPLPPELIAEAPAASP